MRVATIVPAVPLAIESVFVLVIDPEYFLVGTFEIALIELVSRARPLF